MWNADGARWSARAAGRPAATALVALGVAAVGGGATGARAEPDAAPPVLAAARTELVGPPGSGTPRLAAGPAGAVHAIWLEPRAEGAPGAAVRFATRAAGDGTWSPPRTVTEGERVHVDGVEAPALASLGGGALVAVFAVDVPDAPYAYHLQHTRSEDGGVTWSEPRRLHDDTWPAEHGFPSLAPLGDARAVALWLAPLAAPATAGGHGATVTALHARVLGAEPEPPAARVVDARVCDCCRTDVVAVPGGLLAAYRDRDENEVRDVAIARYDAATERWGAPVGVAADGWEFHGCPVNGPAVDATGAGDVVVAWFTAADDRPRVRVAFAAVGASERSDAIDVDDSGALGGVAVAWTPAQGGAVVVWSEEGSPRRLSARTVTRAGALGPAVPLGLVHGARPGSASAVRAGDEVLVAWTAAAGDEGAVRVVALRP